MDETKYYQIKNYLDYILFTKLRQENNPHVKVWTEEEFNAEIKDKKGLPCLGYIVDNNTWGYLPLTELPDKEMDEAKTYLTENEKGLIVAMDFMIKGHGKFAADCNLAIGDFIINNANERKASK